MPKQLVQKGFGLLHIAGTHPTQKLRFLLIKESPGFTDALLLILLDSLIDAGLLVELFLGLLQNDTLRRHKRRQKVLHQTAELIHPCWLNDLQAGKLVVKLQGEHGGEIVLLCQIGNQRTVRFVHEKGTHDDAAQQFILMQQGKGDMVQIRVTGENIGLSQFLCLLAYLKTHRKAPFSRKKIALQQAAVTGALSKGHERFAPLINQVDRQLGKGVEILQYRFQPLPVNPGK